MFVTHLSLADFRSYPVAEVALEPGVTTFTGANGQGKTNLVEAIDYLATLGSHRVSSEQPLVRHGAERAIVRARVQAGLHDGRQLVLEIELLPGRQNRASLNRAPLRRPRELLGALRTVVFSPEDLALVKGDPSERRRFLDELITTRWPRLAGVRADYDRVLRQRSTLLKSLGVRGRGQRDGADASLAVWDESLARFGAELMHARLDTLAALAPHAAAAYTAIAPTNNAARLEYRCAIGADATMSQDEIEARLIVAMGERRGDEIQRGVCLVGPHRDDVLLGLGELPAKGYASHGESWSFALSLKLGAFGLLRDEGVQPVLILDDVFAELDQLRRQRLAGMIAGAEQVLITAAVPDDVPSELGGRRFSVGGGEVRAESVVSDQTELPQGSEVHGARS
ncbi:DNA replication/repair protein RecF [Micropruina sp.]|uniref:DNA replication/repair protein RecF n=1 Tax=Micropruina sp. TaxID=2737536 RepID=UPI0039E29309